MTGFAKTRRVMRAMPLFVLFVVFDVVAGLAVIVLTAPLTLRWMAEDFGRWVADSWRLAQRANEGSGGGSDK